MARKAIDLSNVSTKLRQTPPLDLHHTRVDANRETRYHIYDLGAMYWQRECEKAQRLQMQKDFDAGCNVEFDT